MQVFVAMPFKDKMSERFYRKSIKPICTRLGLHAIRADEIFSASPIIEDIIGAIENAKVIIADITGMNANVFYELGMSHTLKNNQTIMITRDDYEESPFDIRHYRIINYKDTTSGKTKFEHDLEKTLHVILDDPRALKTNEFRQVEILFALLERRQELNNIVARRALGSSPDIGSVWWYEVFSPNGHRSSSISIYDTSIFKGLHQLRYVEFTDKKINLSPIGNAFADFLIDLGYRCAYVNGKKLINNYKPSKFIKEQEIKHKMPLHSIDRKDKEAPR